MADIPFTDHLGTVLLRLGLAVLFSGIIGWDRERLRKPAGLRTHVLVGVGSALIMMVSVSMVDLFPGLQRVDPGRIAAQVVTGIGFLGAGTILHLKEGVVSGLTTAATLWVVSGIGLAVGCGFYSGAVATTLLVMLALFLMNRLDDYIESRLYHNLTIHAKTSSHLTEDAKQIMRDNGVKIQRTEVHSPNPSEKFIVIHFKPIPVASGQGLGRRIERLPGVKEVSFN